jgi:hypothetical protein
VKLTVYSYRYAREILEHPKYAAAWQEISDILGNAPLFTFPGKSTKNKRLSVVQQVMNTYFDRRFALDLKWEYHPLATRIEASGLAADYRKRFEDLSIQAEVQFGNMSRWYSDIFKFQTAYSQQLIQLGLSVVPMGSVARIIDSNVVNYERAFRELPSAELSITLPIMLVGLEPDDTTTIVDLRQCKFANGIKDITGKGKDENRWRIVHAYLRGVDMTDVGPDSETGPMLVAPDGNEE